MLQDIENFLGLSHCHLVGPSVIGVAEAGTDSSFMINNFVSYFLKQNIPVVLISFSQTFVHFNGVGNKLGVSLTKARDENNLLFIEGLKYLSQILHVYASDSPWKVCVDRHGNIDLVTLFRTMKPQFYTFTVNAKNRPAIIIDNISVFSDIGCSDKEIVTFVQLLSMYISNESKNPLVVGFLASDGNSDDTNMLENYLRHTSNIMIEIRGLKTGRSKDIHGQVQYKLIIKILSKLNELR